MSGIFAIINGEDSGDVEYYYAATEEEAMDRMVADYQLKHPDGTQEEMAMDEKFLRRHYFANEITIQ